MYLKTQDIDTAIKTIADLMQEHSPFQLDFTDYEQIKPRLFIKMANAANNREYLENVPHYIIGDIAVCAAVLVNSEKDNFMSTVVTYSLIDAIGIDSQTLLHDATANSSIVMPAKVMSIADVVGYDDGIKILVITNKEMLNGASAILYPGVMQTITDKTESDYFLLPSSVHEFLAVPDNGNMMIEELEAMVREINRSAVMQPDIILSDTIYYYDHSEDKVVTARQYEQMTANKAAG